VIESKKPIEEKTNLIETTLSEFNFQKVQNDEIGEFFFRESALGWRQFAAMGVDDEKFVICVKLTWLDYLAGKQILQLLKDRLSKQACL
jgi:hypothetical protein